MADPAWSNVALLLRGEGVDGSTTFTDTSSTAMSMARLGTETISTAQKKFGSASIKVPTSGGAGLSYADPTAFNNSTLTWEGWCYFDSVAGGGILYAIDGESRIYLAPTGGGAAGELTANSGGVGNTFTTSGAALVAQTFTHIAVVFVPSPGTSRIFVNGLQKGSAVIAGFVGGSHSPHYVCGPTASGSGNSFYDEIRISKEAVYTANFTPPTSAFPETRTSVGAASGTGAATGVGRATKVGAGVSSGTSTAAATGKSTAVSVGASAATSATSATGASTASSVGAGAGTTMVSAIGASTAAATGSTDGIGSAAAVGSSTFTASGDAQGTAQAIGVAVGISVATGAAAGIGAANGAAIPQMVGLSTGIGAAFGVGSNTAMSVGLALAFGGAFGRGTLDAVFPRTLYAVHFGTPIGPNNDAVKVMRTINAARLGYPVAYWIDIS